MHQALFDKYGRPPQPIGKQEEENSYSAPQEDEPEAEKGVWSQFPAVVALSNFLKENREMGIRLVLLDGRPTLHFCPGLDASTSSGRMAVVSQVFGLLSEALPDLEYLIDSGFHVMPEHPGFGGSV